VFLSIGLHEDYSTDRSNNGHTFLAWLDSTTTTTTQTATTTARQPLSTRVISTHKEQRTNTNTKKGGGVDGCGLRCFSKRTAKREQLKQNKAKRKRRKKRKPLQPFEK